MGIFDRFRQPATTAFSQAEPEQAQAPLADEPPHGAPKPGLYLAEDGAVVLLEYSAGIVGNTTVAILRHCTYRSGLMRPEQQLLDRGELPSLDKEMLESASCEVHHVGMATPRTLGIDADSGAYVAKAPDVWINKVHVPTIDWTPVRELTITEERKLRAGELKLEYVDMHAFSQTSFVTAAAAATAAAFECPPLQDRPSPVERPARTPKPDTLERRIGH